MAMTGADVRRWIANFEAAAALDRADLQAHPPSTESVIESALGLVALAGRFSEDPAREDPRERDDDLRAYECWAKLRAAAGRP